MYLKDNSRRPKALLGIAKKQLMQGSRFLSTPNSLHYPDFSYSFRVIVIQQL